MATRFRRGAVLTVRNEMRPVVDDVGSIVTNCRCHKFSTVPPFPKGSIVAVRGETSRDMKRAGSITYYEVGS